MRIAVVSEVSAVNRNPALLEALAGRGHDVINLGMAAEGEKPELTYIHTGFISALALGSGVFDFVVGGCGTGQGFLNSVMQYPGVFCGHIILPLDAWLYARINGGNCVSLALKQGCGWAADVDLRFIFDRLLDGEWGSGYPPHRKESQHASRLILQRVSVLTHRGLVEIIRGLPEEVITPVLGFPRVREFIRSEEFGPEALRAAIRERFADPLPAGTDRR